MSAGLIDGTVSVDARTLLTLHRTARMLFDQIVQVGADHRDSDSVLEALALARQALEQLVRMRR